MGKSAEQSLKETNGLLQAVFDSAPNGIAVMQTIYDGRGRAVDFAILLFNAYTRNWIGETDYKGKRYGDVFPMVKETGILEKFIGVAETGVTANFESWYAGEGMNHWFRFSAVKQGELLVVTTEDISATKKSERELHQALQTTQKQQRLYEAVTNNTPDLVYVFDLNYRFTYANKALLTMWGRSWEDSIGRGLRELGYEEWHATMHEREIDKVVATKKSIRGTVSFPHAVLGKRIYDYIFAPVLNEYGEVEAIAGTTRDITDLKQTEESLQQSEARFRNMIEQAPVAMLLSKGTDVVIESVNAPMLRFMNKTAAHEVLGKKMLEVLPELAGQPALHTVIKVQKTGVPFRGDEQPVNLFINGKLKRRYFNFSYDAIKEAGQTSAVLHMAVDVTEQVLARKKLEESEQDLRNLVLQAPIGICVMNAATLVSEIVNDKFVEIAGKPYETIMGRPYWETFAEAAPYYEAALQGVIETGEPFFANEVELMLIRHGKEEIIYVTFVYEPMKDSNNVVKKVVVWVLENTVQVRARRKVEESKSRYRILSETLEQQVAERTKELQRSNDDLQQFAHVASHDLKEPVRKIKTFTSRLEQLLDGKLDETATRFIERIHVATNRMFTMIDGVLNYSTINASTQMPKSVDLNEVMKSIETDLELTIQETGTKLHYSHLPAIEGAVVLLYQLFYNLVNNAIKFAKAGISPQIIIKSDTLVNDDNRQFVKITLSDNGIGFEKEHASLIFDTFTRLNSKDKFEGTGLGLALCKKIVERHGGNISASGIPGEGATFTILLPLLQNRKTI